MTAPAFNLVQTAAPGVASAAGGNAAAGGGSATGFDALVAALLTGDAAPASGGSSPVVAPEAGEEAAKAAAVETTALDAAAALAAAALFQAVPAAEAPPAIAATEGAKLPQATAGGGKQHAAFVPAQGGLPPGLDGDSALAPETEASETAPPPTTAPEQGLKTDQHATRPAAPAFGRDKPQGAPAQPALDNAAPKADLATKAAESVDPAEAPTPPTEAAPAASLDTAKAPALAAQVARPEPAPAPSKPSRGERAKPAAESADASDGLKPVEAADKPVHARSTQAAAKPAAEAVEAFDPKAREARTDAEQPDAGAQGETRAASQSSTATGPAAPAVRGAPETVANLAAQIVKKLEAKTTRFEVELDPLGLGRVDVRIEIGVNGKMTASMVFENPQAAQELKARAAELQRAMEQAGFDLSGGLSFDLSDQGRRQGQAWQDQADMGGAFRGQAFRAALETASEAVDAANMGALRLRRGVSAGIDVRI